MQAERYIAAADLGSSKIALSVAKVEGDDIQIIYYKETPSDGIAYSQVRNPMRAAAPLRAAIEDAENELHIKILQIVVGLPRYAVRQEVNSGGIEHRSDPGSCITREEVNMLKSMAVDTYEIPDKDHEEIYGAVAQSFSTDEETGIRESDIVGISSECLFGDFKIFVGKSKAVSNIDILLNNAQVAPARKLFLPSAVARAVLTEDERENGVALVEIGAGVTSLTIYLGKILRHYASIPFGGKAITADIRYQGGFNEKLAENIKLAFGACLPDKLPLLGDKILQINDEESGTFEHLPVKDLSRTITCRVREIVEAVLYQIQESGYAERLRNGIVLTGGCANLINIAPLIKEMSGYTVRTGYPRSQAFSAAGVSGVGETSAAATIGMILEAKQDFRLNCIKDAALPVPETAGTEAESGTEKEGFSDNIFSDDPVYNDPGEVITPPKKREKPRKKPDNFFFTWLQRGARTAGEKVRGAAEGAFDKTLGGLFDEMK